MHPLESHPLYRWLEGPPGPRSALLRAGHLRHLQQRLQHWCPEPWMQQIRLANIRGETVVFYSTSAAALTLLRQNQHALLDFLNRDCGLACTRMEAKVRPASPGSLQTRV